MKAKEWAAKITNENILEILKEFVEETVELAQKRGFTDNAMHGAVREQFSKWASVCRLINKEEFGRDLLEDAFIAYAPNIFKVYNDRELHQWQKVQRRNISEEYKKEIEQAKEEPDPQLRLILLLSVYWAKGEELKRISCYGSEENIMKERT